MYKKMFDISSYLGAMSSGLVDKKKLTESKFGKGKKKEKKKRITSYRDYQIDLLITEDDLP